MEGWGGGGGAGGGGGGGDSQHQLDLQVNCQNGQSNKCPDLNHVLTLYNMMLLVKLVCLSLPGVSKEVAHNFK